MNEHDKQQKKIRELIKGIADKIPAEEKEALETMVTKSLVEHLIRTSQETVLETAEMLDMHPFDLMLYTLPEVATGIIKSCIVNILSNLQGDDAKKAKPLIDDIKKYVNDACFPDDFDYQGALKAIRKEVMEAAMKGEIQ